MYRQVIDPTTGSDVISTQVIQRISDGAFIGCSELNTDYQAYLEWVAKGNTILPPE
jgi:hypothetical protein